jgi:hypothetical protein
MRETLFKKVLIKSITLLFSVLVWGQPALGCDDRRMDQASDLRPEIKKGYGAVDNGLAPILFEDESTPASVVSLRLNPSRAYHEPAQPDRSQSLLRLRSARER